VTPTDTAPALRYFRFVVPGLPVAKGRPRFARVGSFVKAYTPEATVRFEERVRLHAREAGVEIINEGAVELRVVAYWPMKGSPLKRGIRPACLKTTKPDCDNILKTCDALNGIAWRDDAQVVRATVEKWHCAQDDPDGARVEVTVRALDPDSPSPSTTSSPASR
jgi:Holliday junction resolvase RusA-like endonuclease